MDHAIEIRQGLIASADVTPASSADDQIKAMQYRNGQKRIEAINYLGASWVHSPAYDAEKHPHHAPAIKHSVILRAIAILARAEGRL
jgi:hypothetical protein